MSEESLLLDAVSEAARLGGARAMTYFGAALDVERKTDGSPVTIADREVERMLRDWLARRFPGDGVIGEELPEHNAGAERRWIIDPIDGTRSFTHGVPFWGTLVAVARGEEILAGAIACAAADVLVSAATGQGCWLNGARCRVSAVTELSRACVLTSDVRWAPGDRRRGWEALVQRADCVRTWGDCYGYAMVATGRAEVMVDPVVQPWDAAALVPVIREAGGVITDWAGRTTAFGGSVIASNAALAREAHDALGAPWSDA